MSVQIGINGFGRIGRLMFRQAIQDKTGKFKILAINDSKDVKYLMYMLKYDSAHGKYQSMSEWCWENVMQITFMIKDGLRESNNRLLEDIEVPQEWAY